MSQCYSPKFSLPSIYIFPVSNFHLDNFIDLFNLFIGQELFHHQSLLTITASNCISLSVSNTKPAYLFLSQYRSCCLSLSAGGMLLSVIKTVLAHCLIHSFFIAAI